jgi:small subunit ribosomal protein S6
MRRYEIIFVLAPDLPDTDLEDTIDGYKVAAEEMGAKVLGVDKWVRRRLAFPVKKYTEGTYVFLLVEEEQAKAVAELERRFKVTDSVIRFLTIRADGTDKRIQKAIAHRDERRKKRDQRKDAANEPGQTGPDTAAKPTPKATTVTADGKREQEV